MKKQDYININKNHPKLSLELLQAERKTQLCIQKLLHLNAWKHRMNGDKKAMLECQKLAMTALRTSKTYEHILLFLF
jgi:ssRNA-specific RNase YbeY (16S rRNA maturation enzyme)